MYYYVKQWDHDLNFGFEYESQSKPEQSSLATAFLDFSDVSDRFTLEYTKYSVPYVFQHCSTTTLEVTGTQ